MDIVRQQRDLQREKHEKSEKVERLIRQVSNKKTSYDIDQAVRNTIQKARRNVTLLQKVSNGIYKVKNKP